MSALKEGDLRVGNWVNANYNGFSKDIQLLGIDNGIIRHSAYPEMPLPIKHFKPIELNEDWVIRFGFEETDELACINEEYTGKRYRHRCGRMSLINLTTGWFQWFCVGDPWYSTTIGCQLEHVHDLQNRYQSYTGSELELANQVKQKP